MDKSTTQPALPELKRRGELLERVLGDLAGPLSTALGAYVQLVDRCIEAGRARGLGHLDFDDMLGACGLEMVNAITATVLEIDREVNAALDR